MKKLRLNLVQLVFLPIVNLIIIIFLSNWLRDLIVLEWDITVYLAQVLGMIILGFIAIMVLFNIYCLIKLYYLITKFISAEKLEAELYRIKSRN